MRVATDQAGVHSELWCPPRPSAQAGARDSRWAMEVLDFVN